MSPQLTAHVHRSKLLLHLAHALLCVSFIANNCPLGFWETHLSRWDSGIPRDVHLYHILRNMVQMGWDSGIPRDVRLYHILHMVQMGQWIPRDVPLYHILHSCPSDPICTLWYTGIPWHVPHATIRSQPVTQSHFSIPPCGTSHILHCRATQ